MRASNIQRYTRTAIALHWLIAVAILGLIGLGWYMVDIPKNTPERGYFFNLHKSIGLTTGFFILLRLWWRATHVPPPLATSLRLWERRLATWTHRLLYVCMVLMPLSGYVASNFTKFGVKYFGIELAPWGPENKLVYGFFNSMHVFTSYVFVALIALHIAGALKHLVIDRDGELRRMLPRS